jgi:branched-chain amino acid transport system ATP-binding protein
MLTATGIEVAYGPVTAVRGADLTVGPGEVLAVVGSNGAGKTSLLHAICGVVRPTAGTVEVDGRDLTGAAPERMVTAGVALVPEGRRIFAGLTVEENLRLASADGSGVEGILERFPALARRRDRQAGVLSGGEAQQLAIGRALLTRPRVLLLDEPSLGLSPVMVDTVFATIDELRAEGYGIVLVEQQARRALAIADRSMVMRGGRLDPVQDGAAADLDLYLGAATRPEVTR